MTHLESESWKSLEEQSFS